MIYGEKIKHRSQTQFDQAADAKTFAYLGEDVSVVVESHDREHARLVGSVIGSVIAESKSIEAGHNAAQQYVDTATKAGMPLVCSILPTVETIFTMRSPAARGIPDANLAKLSLPLAEGVNLHVYSNDLAKAEGISARMASAFGKASDRTLGVREIQGLACNELRNNNPFICRITWDKRL